MPSLPPGPAIRRSRAAGNVRAMKGPAGRLERRVALLPAVPHKPGREVSMPYGPKASNPPRGRSLGGRQGIHYPRHLLDVTHHRQP